MVITSGALVTELCQRKKEEEEDDGDEGRRMKKKILSLSCEDTVKLLCVIQGGSPHQNWPY